jgi:branched-chain amino acid transport system substrate-binding protein
LILSGCKKSPEPSTPNKPAAGAPAAKPAADATPIKVGAIFAISGPASFLGAPEAKTVEMFVEKLNAAGGVNGRKIEMLIRDSGASTEKAISLAKQLIEEDKVLAILGPSTSGETLGIKGLCQESQTILVSCAAAEEIVVPMASYVFKTPQKDSQAAQWIFNTMKDLGIKKIGVITSNTGFGKGGKAQLEKMAPENGVEIAVNEVYEKEATDLTGVLTKVKGAGVQAVVNWSIEPAQGIVAKNMKQIQLDVPLFQSHGYGNIKYVQGSGEAANGTIFPCGRLLVAADLPANHPQKAVLTQYKQDYEAKYKEDASTFGGHAYDAILILTEAIKKAGSTDKKAVRDTLETLTGVVGTAGVFNYSAQDHNGLALDAFDMLTVKDGKFAFYKK